jgi:hypothetical protein
MMLPVGKPFLLEDAGSSSHLPGCPAYRIRLNDQPGQRLTTIAPRSVICENVQVRHGAAADRRGGTHSRAVSDRSAGLPAMSRRPFSFPDFSGFSATGYLLRLGLARFPSRDYTSH